ncbi:MAG: glycosyltransferase family 39 protein [candidate division Zixibacteria bacterium]|nr:glycosyltransferase family 39 protein [candidate division Zixibacteria bacterium]
MDAATHPLHNLIGHLWGKLPFEDYAYSQNLLSAIFASLTICVVYFINVKITSSRVASFITSLALAVSHTFWWLAVVNESYSLVFFFFALCIFSTIIWVETRNDKWLYLFTFSFGLGISDHYILLIVSPVFIVLFFMVEPNFFNLRRIFLMLICFLVGTSLLIYIIVSQYSSLSLDLFEKVYGGPSKLLSEALRYPFYILYQFPVFGFLLGCGGAWKLMKRDKKIFYFLILLFLSDMVFSAWYMWERQPEMMVPSYIVFSLWIGMGVKIVFEKIRNASVFFHDKFRYVIPSTLFLFLVIFPVVFYYGMPHIVKKFGIRPLKIRSLPYRDNDRYFLLPDKSSYFGAYEFGKEVFKIAEPNSIIIADFTPYEVLLYFQTIRKLRPDIELCYTWPDQRNPIDQGLIEKNIDKRAIYLVDIDDYPNLYKTGYLKGKYKFVPRGPLYQIQRKE